LTYDNLLTIIWLDSYKTLVVYVRSREKLLVAPALWRR